MSNPLPFRLVFQVLALLLPIVASTTPIASPSVDIGQPQQPLDSEQLTQADTLRGLIEERGRVRVIVSIDSLGQADGSLSGLQAIEQLSARSARVGAIADLQDRVLSRFGARTEHSIHRFKYTSHIALEIDAPDLALLESIAEITSIDEDRILQLALDDSVYQVGAPAAWAMDATGAGQVVAVLDTGVDTSHGAFGDRVLDEACFSTTYQSIGTSSLCPNGDNPNGMDRQIGAGAASICTGMSGCDHGTHVAGIVASGDALYSGVALEAQLLAIQVFSNIENTGICGSSNPCLVAFTSDIIRALEYVYELAASTPIASVNMSLGGGGYSSPEACDAANRPTKDAIDNLRAAGVLTIISSGNSGKASEISEPGCISSAVSVGAVDSNNAVVSFSNSAEWLTTLAPGLYIRSSVPGGGFANKSGTSMAAPHVAGAVAALKSAEPEAGPEQILASIVGTGLSIVDGRNGTTTPLVQVDLALVDLSEVLDPSVGEHNITGTVLLGGEPLASVGFSISSPGVCSDTDSSGGYQCIVPDGWGGIVTPIYPGTAFEPLSIQYANVTEGLGAQDYVAFSGDPISIWDDSVDPQTPVKNANPVEFGVKFRSDVDGVVTGLRFYKLEGDPGPHVGHLWAVDGTLLASTTFTNESEAGWQEQPLSDPVAINADTTYIASYHAGGGWWWMDNGYFAAGAVGNAPLRALADGEDGPNGVYKLGAAGGFPDQPYQSTNFWVDILFIPGEVTSTPNIAITVPTDGAVVSSTPMTVSGTVDDDAAVVDVNGIPAAVSAGTFITAGVPLTEGVNQLTASAANAAGGHAETSISVVLDTTAPVISIDTPADGAVVSSPSITVSGAVDDDAAVVEVNGVPAIVSSGIFGVVGVPLSEGANLLTASATDVVGNRAETSVSVTLDKPDSTMYSIWGDFVVPQTPVKNASPVEFGVKFRSDVDGVVTGLRFYKLEGDPGPHVGHLWAVDGTLLASTTFTNESEAGWQEQPLSDPVAINADTTYIASYHAGGGWWWMDNGYFAAGAVGNAPLRALADGEDGPNGVYKLGAAGGFPDQPYQSTNFWVDLVFAVAVVP